MERKIAVICDYVLLPDRVGGMDYFFWAFHKKCKANNLDVDWFFPNISEHGSYHEMTILAPENDESLTNFVSHYFKNNNRSYSHVFTHFVELCTSFYKELKYNSAAKIVAVDHNPRPLGGYALSKRIKKRIKGFLYSKHIDLFVGVSIYTVNEIINDFGNHLKRKTKVLYNGVIIESIQERTNRNIVRPTFIVACHLRKSKGVQDLITAVKSIQSNNIEGMVIDIYGDGPFRQELEVQVAREQLEKIFNFKGSVSDLNERYKSYDYMILPSHMECFSLGILESLAANVPVIASNVGGNEEAVQHSHNGYIFNAKAIDELAKIIEEVYQGNKQITINTRQEIENLFSLDKMVNEYYKLLS